MHVFKKSVNYYRQRVSHVFICFIDYNKSFHSVDYWLLFCKFLDSNDIWGQMGTIETALYKKQIEIQKRQKALQTMKAREEAEKISREE